MIYYPCHYRHGYQTRALIFGNNYIFFNGGLTLNYAINNLCLFNPEDRLLSSINYSVDPIVLSKHAAKALLTFVISPQEVVSRERLFSVIWADESSFASNASLNNYISEVRKALLQFNVCDVIETIPRLGFKFTGVVKNVLRDTNEKQPEISYHQPLKNRKKTHIRFSVLLLCITIFASTVVASLLYLHERDTLDNDYLFTLDKCDVYLLTWSNDERESEHYIKKAIESENVNCKASFRSIFFSEGRRYNNIYKTQMITVCDKISAEEYADCVNVKTESK
ncbi:winged helix-turn-helix domain-containing protein [Klebsiella aerogenes]